MRASCILARRVANLERGREGERGRDEVSVCWYRSVWIVFECGIWCC